MSGFNPNIIFMLLGAVVVIGLIYGLMQFEKQKEREEGTDPEMKRKRRGKKHRKY